MNKLEKIILKNHKLEKLLETIGLVKGYTKIKVTKFKLLIG